jgi:hypothetical protein
MDGCKGEQGMARFENDRIDSEGKAAKEENGSGDTCPHGCKTAAVSTLRDGGAHRLCVKMHQLQIQTIASLVINFRLRERRLIIIFGLPSMLVTRSGAF